MPSCCIPSCDISDRRGIGGKSIYLLPVPSFTSQPIRRMRWFDLLKLNNALWEEDLRVCSLHFCNNCYSTNKTVVEQERCIRLKKNAVPHLVIDNEGQCHGSEEVEMAYVVDEHDYCVQAGESSPVEEDFVILKSSDPDSNFKYHSLKKTINSELKDVCRICLQAILDANFKELCDKSEENIFHIIRSMMPDLDLFIYSYQAVCGKCCEIIESFTNLRHTSKANEVLMVELINRDSEIDLIINEDDIVKNEGCEESKDFDLQNDVSDFELKPPEDDIVADAKHQKESKALECDICHKILSTTSSFQKHKKRHKMHNKLQCHVCAKSYSEIHDLTEHIKSHNPVKEFICDQCGAAFHAHKNLQMHQKLHLDPKHTCTQCHKIFHTRSNLRRHFVSVHDESKRFTCDQCKRVFKTESCMLTHKELKHDWIPDLSKVWKCPVCQKYFKLPFDQAKHLQNHPKNSQCQFCEESYAGEEALISHVVQNHPDLPWQRACRFCSKIFALEKSLIKHLKHGHSFDYVTQTRIPPKRVWQCKHCGKEFPRCSKLKEHLQSHSEGKSVSCQHCVKSFKNTAYLRKHELMFHVNQKWRYTCEFCQHKYGLLAEFVRHKVGAHGWDPEDGESKAMIEKYCAKKQPWKCPLCEKEFMPRSKYRHLKTHNSCQFVCEYCPKTFMEERSLKSHLMIFHKLNETWKFTCAVCNHRFFHKVALINHAKKKHGIDLVKIKNM